MKGQVPPVIVQHEAKRVLRLLAWVTPEIAAEVLRVATAKTKERQRRQLRTMIGPEWCGDMFGTGDSTVSTASALREGLRVRACSTPSRGRVST